jgi:hypothetical protein
MVAVIQTLRLRCTVTTLPLPECRDIDNGGCRDIDTAITSDNRYTENNSNSAVLRFLVLSSSITIQSLLVRLLVLPLLQLAPSVVALL